MLPHYNHHDVVHHHMGFDHLPQPHYDLAYAASHAHSDFDLMNLAEATLMNLGDAEHCDAKRVLDPRDYECFCMEGDHANPWKPHCKYDLNKPAPCD